MTAALRSVFGRTPPAADAVRRFAYETPDAVLAALDSKLIGLHDDEVERRRLAKALTDVLAR